MRGYFGIGIENCKTEHNIGTLWRSSYSFGASFIFTIGKRYKHQCSDTSKTYNHIPLYNFEDFNDFLRFIPYSCQLIGVEITEQSKLIEKFAHPLRCIYILGPEDGSISSKILDKCQHIVKLPGRYCHNVSVAGSLVMYDRTIKYLNSNINFP